MAANRLVLWQLPLSHYSEKVRWALDYKALPHERHTPIAGYHMVLALVLTKGRQYTLPVIELDGRRIGNSSTIIAALEQRHPDPPLYPSNPDERRRALALEAWFDEQLGPAIRRYVFHMLRGQRELFGELAIQQIPPPFQRHPRVAGAYARVFTGARFQAVSDDKAEAAREQTVAALDRLEAELGENQYLVGERFTVADLTAAALFYPLVLPPEGPVQMDVPPPVSDLRDSLAGRRGYQWVNEMFARHRRR